MPEMRIGGARVAFREAGQGPDVLLLHCSSSHSGQWAPLIDALAPRHHVRAPDFLGYGRSDPLPEDGAPCSRHDAALVARMLADAAGPVHLVGHSLGGTVALRAALAEPARVASLTMIEPVLFGLLEEAGHPARLETLQIAQDLHVLLAFRPPAEAARAFTDFWGGPGAFDALPPATRDYVTATIGRVAADFRALSHLAPGAIGRADLAALTVPVRLISGGATRPAARAVIELLRQALPGAAWTEIAGAAHMAPVTHARKVNAAIMAGLDAAAAR
jgi:pimeloyl-ACP methyl ester carboxylesterase